MTNQKYKIGDRVLVDATIIDEDNLKVEVFSHERSICYPLQIRPHTPKPEFEYGEEVEVSDNISGKWYKAIFKTYLPNPNVQDPDPYPFFVHVCGQGYTSWFAYCRKLQPKKELIEINGKKYDAEKVKERLADLKAEE